ncbi:putative phosphorylase [Aspergillus homomorphus CBS 101889]|uniref:Uncharacterized protein n=1 Tax=Aspergillus homomorphus (strain CBS 101889) TaxID=1450537 RepID=A0A395HG65_ASPHC|nr:hypothetical protein BO97DRAFT_447420 [Aspergillus homomorphus CBS 101889]RAL06626.1 hypothetical protein BO97DRAFT_447420 [Aspergillus homomorphus CBS 101889]
MMSPLPPSSSAKRTLAILTNATALSEFDALVRRGLVVYAPSKVVRLTVDNFQFEFHINQSLANKPQSGQGLQVSDEKATSSNDGNKPPTPSSKPATFGPGSDLACPTPDLIIATIHTTHILVPNAYCVFRPQFLLLTQDSYRRQHEPLDQADLEAARAVLCALGDDRPYFAMFNCGRTAGASRQHKHMHIIPCSDEDIDHVVELPTERSRFENGDGAPKQPILPSILHPRAEDIPFAHFRVSLSASKFRDLAYSKFLHDAYVSLLEEMHTALGGDGECIAHNVILIKDWIMVIPRSKDRNLDVAVNGAGMVGSVWLDREEMLARWLEIGPVEVLRGVGYTLPSE